MPSSLTFIELAALETEVFMVDETDETVEVFAGTVTVAESTPIE